MKKIWKHAGNFYTLLSFAMTKYKQIKTKERIFHANGSGFYGDFILTKSLSNYTTSQFLTQENKKFKIGIRFSNTIADHGTSEMLRDNRGFSIRFYGDKEFWDIVGLSTPVQWIDDLEQTMLLHDSMVKNFINNKLDYNNKWNFISGTPAALHVMTMIHSDTGIPKGWQHMNGYGGNVFSLINDQNKKTWVKFHFRTQQGREFYTDEEAAQISFERPDKMTRDMINLIQSQNFPKWKVYVQLMEENEWKNLDFNVFSTVNVWPHGQFPLIEIGEIELNQIPFDQLEEFEKAAFAPGNLPKGIGVSPDYSLTVRIMSYPKLQELRLGKNINPVSDRVKKEMEEYKTNAIWLEGQNKQSEDHYYAQPRRLWEMFDQEQKNRLHKNIARSLSKADQPVIDKMIYELNLIDPGYAEGVLKEINLIHD